MKDDWVEPWVGECFQEWDLLAVLAELGLPVRPLDVAALPSPAYDLLYDWAIHRSEHLTKRQQDAEAEAKKPKAGAPRAAGETGG